MATKNALNINTTTSGLVLTSNGTALTPTFQTYTGGKWTLIQNQNISNGATTVDFTSLGSSPVIMCIFSILPQPVGTSFQMLVSTDGGSTWLGTGNYAGGVENIHLDGSGTSNGNSSAFFFLCNATDTVIGGAGTMIINKNNPLQICGTSSCKSNVSVPVVSLISGQSVNSVNALRFQLNASQPFASGFITLYGLAQS